MVYKGYIIIFFSNKNEQNNMNKKSKSKKQ